MRRFVLVALICALAGRVRDADANGRPPGTSTLHFRQGHESDIIAGLTFGLVVSHDNGATWQWMCEKAVGYGGMYDPDYAYSQSGSIFATTFDGLKVSRDGCTFAATPPGMTFVSQTELGPDHALYYTAADSVVHDSKIYKSTDDGVTFPQSTNPGMPDDWWQTLIVAPSDANRVYLSGYRFVMVCNTQSPTPYMTCSGDPMCMDATHPNGKCEGQKLWLLFKSVNGAQSFTPLPGNMTFSGNTTAVGLTTSTNSGIDFVGVDHTNADILYARVTLENGNTVGDGIYKINTATGTTWTSMLHKTDGITFLARGSGDLIAATPTLGAFKSTNQGGTWTSLPTAPHINCLAENSAGEVWACTQNYGNPPAVPSDGFGIMKSTDLSTWTGVLKYQDISAPVACAAGTAQQDACVGDPINGVWCNLRMQLGITSSAVSCVVPEAGPDVAGPGKPPKGCCDTGAGGGAAAGVLSMFVAGTLLLRRRRPKRR